MFQSQKCISSHGLRRLYADLLEFLRRKQKVRCKSLGRFVSLQKLPDAIMNRRDAKRRLQAFFVGIDIVQHSSSYLEVQINGMRCFEFRGLDAMENMVIVHIREEKIRNDRFLFFISCATKVKVVNKRKLPPTS